jgi:site-specific recombinase XerD
VFPTPAGTMRTPEDPPPRFERQLAEAGCHRITFHDLRHTAASMMVMSGMALRTVQQQLGHSTIAITERYAHLAPSFVNDEVERLKFDIERGGVIPFPVAAQGT